MLKISHLGKDYDCGRKKYDSYRYPDDIFSGAHSATCLDSHMPEASKSAIKKGVHQGDVKTHIFKINTAADAQFFNEAGNLANVDGNGVTLDMICYKCHKDAKGEGGSMSQKTMEQLSAKAATFHK